MLEAEQAKRPRPMQERFGDRLLPHPRKPQMILPLPKSLAQSATKEFHKMTSTNMSICASKISFISLNSIFRIAIYLMLILKKSHDNIFSQSTNNLNSTRS